MATTIVIASPSYGSEGPYNALRLADALLVKGEWVDLFFIGDGVGSALAGQDPRGTHASLEEMLVEVLAKGGTVALCGTCCRTRGIDDADVVDGAGMATIHDLADLVLRGDRVLSF